jgi:hypothetical protein
VLKVEKARFYMSEKRNAPEVFSGVAFNIGKFDLRPGK